MVEKGRKAKERVPVSREWRRDSAWSALWQLLFGERVPPPVLPVDPRFRSRAEVLPPFLREVVPANWAEGLEFDDDARRSFRLRAMVPPPFPSRLPPDHAVRLSRRGPA